MGKDTHEFLMQLKHAVDQDDFDQAAALLTDQALEQFPTPYTYLYQCIVWRHFAKKETEILTAANRGLEIAPDFVQLIEIKLSSLVALEYWQEAGEVGLLLCKEQPFNYQVHFTTADVLEKSGWPQESSSVRSQGHYAAASTFLNNGRHEQALSEFDQSLEFNPSHGRARMRRVDALWALDRQAEAEQALLANIEIPDIRIDALVDMCQWAESRGDIQEIDHWSQTLLGDEPHHPYALRVRIRWARSAGTVQKSFDALDASLSEHPLDMWSNFARYALAQELSTNASFLNSAIGTHDFWRVMAVWLDTGMIDAATDKIIHRVDASSEYVEGLEVFCQRLSDGKHFKTVRRLLDDIPRDIWSQVPFLCFYGDALGESKSFNAGINYFSKQKESACEDETLTWMHSKWSVRKALYTIIEPLTLKACEAHLPVILGRLKRVPDDGEAMYCLGGLYCMAEKYVDAEKWLARARSAGIMLPKRAYWHAKANYYLGNVEKAFEDYIDLFEKRMYRDEDLVQFNDLKEKMMATLVEGSEHGLLEHFASDLTADEQYFVGRQYGKKETSNDDLAKACYWYKLAGQNGEDIAFYSLGLAYEFAEGVDQDFMLAMQYYLKSVDKWPEACLSIARLYEEERGHEFDAHKIVHWIEKAAQLGSENAQKHLAFRYYELEEIQDYEKAFRLIQKPAQKGDKDSQQLLAYFYATGLGVEVNMVEAKKWKDLSDKQEGD